MQTQSQENKTLRFHAMYYSAMFYFRFIVLLAALCASATTLSADTKLSLIGRVKDAVTKADLTDAKVYLVDSEGVRTDSVTANMGKMYNNGEIIDISTFSFLVPHCDSIYIMEFECPGYEDFTMSYTVKNPGKREISRTIPVTFLKRGMSKKLDELEVKSSKIKFFHKGDTIVFNADAFQLAEGSMLDALIAQIPGVELSEGGQIKYNGEFVESLLLNGKEFFDGNKQLMLENIGAYTVKNVEVYEGQTQKQKWEGDEFGETQLTMNVKLKKEYMRGWIVNLQAGLGTKERYTLRAFASFFTPTTNLALTTNFNNLNDTRTPGKNDTWSPEAAPSGTRTYKSVGFNYSWEDPEQTKSTNGYLEYEQTSSNNFAGTSRTNFLSSGNTYDNVFSQNRTRKMRLETRNRSYFSTPSLWLAEMIVARYITNDNSSNSLSGTFNKEQTDMTVAVLEAIYGDPSKLDQIINRSITRSDVSGHEYELQFFPNVTYKIPRTSDRISLELGVKYNDKKEERWADYNVNFGADPNPAICRRNYFDNSPNRTLTLMSNLAYNTTFRLSEHTTLHAGLNFEYRFTNRDRDSYMYALDRLEDLGIYGTLPSGWTETFDPSNSYTSRLMENKYSLQPLFVLSQYQQNGNALFIFLQPELSLLHRHFDYWRDNRAYLETSNSFVGTVNRYNARVDYELGAYGTGRRRSYRHNLQYEYRLNTRLPDMVHTIDVVNDADPLNISLGNPNLKNSYAHSHKLRWNYSPESMPLNNNLSATFNHTDNALVRGYTYNTSTGVRRTRTYNVDGNFDFGAENYLNLQFGPTKQFTLTSTTTAVSSHYADMIGVNSEQPEKSTVRSFNWGENLKFAWQFGKQQLSAHVSFQDGHVTSTREDFSKINSQHYHYGITGNFKLPMGFGISTDFTVYTRSGYGVKELDTSDVVWNTRITYTPRGGRFVFMADGFDMLHQLSNVNYAVNASGRTITYTNALPRYILFSVQYRLNIQPRK